MGSHPYWDRQEDRRKGGHRQEEQLKAGDLNASQ